MKLNKKISNTFTVVLASYEAVKDLFSREEFGDRNLMGPWSDRVNGNTEIGNILFSIISITTMCMHFLKMKRCQNKIALKTKIYMIRQKWNGLHIWLPAQYRYSRCNCIFYSFIYLKFSNQLQVFIFPNNFYFIYYWIPFFFIKFIEYVSNFF